MATAVPEDVTLTLVAAWALTGDGLAFVPVRGVVVSRTGCPARPGTAEAGAATAMTVGAAVEPVTLGQTSETSVTGNEDPTGPRPVVAGSRLNEPATASTAMIDR